MHPQYPQQFKKDPIICMEGRASILVMSLESKNSVREIYRIGAHMSYHDSPMKEENSSQSGLKLSSVKEKILFQV